MEPTRAQARDHHAGNVRAILECCLLEGDYSNAAAAAMLALGAKVRQRARGVLRPMRGRQAPGPLGHAELA